MSRQHETPSEAVANDEVHISEPRKHRALFNKLTANAQCSIFARSVIIIFKVRKKIFKWSKRYVILRFQFNLFGITVSN